MMLDAIMKDKHTEPIAERNDAKRWALFSLDLFTNGDQSFLRFY